jgi:hypothetical protein
VTKAKSKKRFPTCCAKNSLHAPLIKQWNLKEYKHNMSNIMRPSFTTHNCPPRLLDEEDGTGHVLLSMHSGGEQILQVFTHIRSILLLLLFFRADGWLFTAFIFQPWLSI